MYNEALRNVEKGYMRIFPLRLAQKYFVKKQLYLFAVPNKIIFCWLLMHSGVHILKHLQLQQL